MNVKITNFFPPKKLAAKVFIMMCLFRHAAFLTYCQSGTYELKPPGGGKEVCPLCPSGTFMPFYDHRLKECFACTEIENPHLEILISPCNKTQDAVIECVPGYYRRLPRNPREKATCLKCSECRYPYYTAKSCQTYEDTMCCLGENYDIYVNGDGVPLCRERAWMCRRGQYYDPESAQCNPCPNNTYMDLDYHSMTKCWDCQKPLGHLHSVVLQSCNGTHPLHLGCKEGYFISHSMGYTKEDIGCSACTQCITTDQKYEGRECDQFNDAVCCPEPNMTVQEGPGGFECLSALKRIQPGSTHNETVCGQNQFLDNGYEGDLPTCRPCRQGTYMNELRHTQTSCKEYPLFSSTSFPASYPDCKRNSYIDTLYAYRIIGSAILVLLVVLFICFCSYSYLILRHLLQNKVKHSTDALYV